MHVLLISTYELGRQSFGVASAAARLGQLGVEVECLDLSVGPMDLSVVQRADLIAFHIPMHMATRMAMKALDRVRQVNPITHICFFGLYASANAPYLKKAGAQTILGGEFEPGLVNLVHRLAPGAKVEAEQVEPLVSLQRHRFVVPDRHGLPSLDKYAHLFMPDGSFRTVGSVESTRGCKHLCRHCPIVPVYNGVFRAVPREVVLEDVRRQVLKGAEHITFGDPDFFNGVSHGIRIVEALHSEFPLLTYDVTIKVEHLLKHRDRLETLKGTGCLFITSAVESFDESLLQRFAKNHNKADFEIVLQLCRQIEIDLIPTFVAFTPWTTRNVYSHFLEEIARLDLVEQVPPIQYSIRLLIPPGSKLLELPEVRRSVGNLDEASLSYRWSNPDPSIDELQRNVQAVVDRGDRQHWTRTRTFHHICRLVDSGAEWLQSMEKHRTGGSPQRCTIPYLTEPWYC